MKYLSLLLFPLIVQASPCSKLFKKDKQISTVFFDNYQDKLLISENLALRIKQNLDKLTTGRFRFNSERIDLKQKTSRLIEFRGLLKNNIWYGLNHTKKYEGIKAQAYKTAKDIESSNKEFEKTLRRVK